MRPCWGCGRPARGFGHLDLRRPVTDPQRAPYRWAFCSATCQNAFHQLYSSRYRSDPASVEDLLPVTQPLSHQAQRACLQALASVADRVGFDVPLAQYTQAQATQVIEAVTCAYEAAIRQRSNPRVSDDAPFDDPIPF